MKAPGQAVVNHGTLLRIELSVSASAPPRVTRETVIASGLAEQASAGAFVVGPTGVALIGSTAYVAGPLANSVIKVAGAATRTSSAGTGTTVTSGGLLHHPIAMVAAPDGDLVVTNGLNGDLVEIRTTPSDSSPLRPAASSSPSRPQHRDRATSSEKLCSGDLSHYREVSTAVPG